MQIPWLKPVVDRWKSSQTQGRTPHALMLTGSKGTGKRCAAAWLAGNRLGISSAAELPQFPLRIPEHADLRWVSTPADKQSVGIEQIRDLVADLSLTSYAGRGKVAIIEPADLMTTNAANSLLKTLEEPPGETLLILIADRPGRLPATVTSRCQRMLVQVPTQTAALEWLQQVRPGPQWLPTLRQAGFAPLAALDEIERLDDTELMGREFAAIAEHSAAPLEVAAKWAKQEPEFVLGWMGRQIQQCISFACGAGSGASPVVVSDSVLSRIDRRNLFCYLDIINRLRGQPAGSFNVQLTLECLLIEWAEGLQSVADAE